MPVLNYTADGAEPERFEFAFDDLPFPEVVALEKLTEKNWGDIEAAYWADNFEVQGNLLLVLMRRRESALTMEQLDLRPRQLTFDVTAEERAAFVRNMLSRADLTTEQRAALTTLGFTEGDDAPAEVAEDPKA